MRNIFKDAKIKKELKHFKEFKKNYNFEYRPLEKKGESVFFMGTCIRENEDTEWVSETDDFVNVSYKGHGKLPKVLSNLFPYEFYFKGHKFASVEGFFQGIKFKNKKAQKLVFKMYGTMSNNIKVAQDYDWQKEQAIYFLGKKYNRHSKEYEELCDELYCALLQNPLYVGALKAVGEKYILHAIGCEDDSLTVFSRFEFERELNCLKDYCLKNK